MASKVDVDKFDGKGDFSLWKTKMKALLIHHKCAKALDSSIVVSDKVTTEMIKDWSESAHSIIILHLSDKVLRLVGDMDTALELWNKLDKLFLIKTLPNKILLKERLFGFKIDSTKSMEENIDILIKITLDLANIGEKVPSEDQAIILLNGLPESYNDVKSAIKYGRDSLDFDHVVNALKSKDLDLRKDKRHDDVLYSRGREEKRFSKGGSSWNSGRSKSRSKSRPKKETRKCHFCNKEGHLKKNCFEFKRQKGKGEDSKAGKESANVSQSFDNLGIFFIRDESEVEEAHVTHSRDEEWVLDSGCSFHMSPIREFFVDFQQTEGKKVYMGNDQYCKVEGYGSVQLKLSDGMMGMLSNVRFVPDLKRNLISLGTLDKNGYTYKGGNGQLKVLKGSLVKMKAELKGGLYILNGEALTQKETAMFGSHKKAIETEIWHQRLGHISEKGLLELHKQGLLGNGNFCPLETCEHCLCGKAAKVKFQRGLHCTKGKLDYIHSDLWGPSATTTHGGARYFISIIDDFSRKVWVFPLKQKSEAFQRFKDWLILVQNQLNRKVKVLRTDNGLEFLNSNFKKLCEEQGIKRHLTVPYTPQQNGVAERMNRTLIERVRCMLLASNMPKEFWGEAVVTAAYLINRSPSAALESKTPEEVWTGVPPNLENLRVFGCASYAHVVQDKLDSRALKCVLLGYSSEAKGYRLWCVERGNEKHLISRNVKFVEEKFPFKEGKVSSENDEEDPMFVNPTISTRYEDLGENGSGISGLRGSSSSNQQGVGNQGSFSGSSSGSGSFSGPSEEQGSSSGSGSGSHERQGSATRVSSVSQGSGSGSSDARQGSSDSGHDEIYRNPRNQQDLRVDSERMRRQVKKPTRYGFDEFALNTVSESGIEEPLNLKGVEESKYKAEWYKAIEEELQSLEKNSSWSLVKRPLDQKIIGCKWIFKVKSNGDSIRFKARLVAKGFTQEYGVDYNEVFSPVVRHTSIRVLLSLVAKDDLELEQLDVKTAFLHGDLDERIYMMQPPGFEKGGEEKVCLLKKSIYGLKQSPRQWYKRFDNYILSNGFVRSNFDSCVYFKHCLKSDPIYLLLYVDDMLVASKSKAQVEKVKEVLFKEFEMKDLGPSKHILGMEIRRERKKGLLYLSQARYVTKLLEKFRMDDSKVVSIPYAPHFKLSSELCPKTEFEIEEMSSIPYSNAVGSLMYGMICTRPDLAYSMSMVSRFMANPGKSHWEVVKWIMRYINGSRTSCLVFGYEDPRMMEKEIEGFVDADYAADVDRRRSLTGFVYKVFGSPVSWKSSLQHVVALSTTESEYIALAEAVKEGMWLKGLLTELSNRGCVLELKCDSQSAIHLSKHQAHHERTKHIDVRLHFLRDVFNQDEFQLLKVSTQRNAADMLTKPVPRAKLEICLGLVNFKIR